MPNVSAQDQADKIARETWWAVTGRAIADAARNGEQLTLLFMQAREKRELEYRQIALTTQFAAVLRQLADAYTHGRETASYVQQLVSLRLRELGPDLSVERQLELREYRSRDRK
jgi:hypothetical protein